MEEGICLNDEVFEPYIEEIFEEDFRSCEELIQEKTFNGNREACDNFSQVEFVMALELEDQEDMKNPDDFTKEHLESFFIQKILKTSNTSVDYNLKRLKSPDLEESNEALRALGGLVALGNKKAYQALFSLLCELPVIKTIEDVHDRMKLLEQMKWFKDDPILMGFLEEEIYRTPANNTTRQWISAIFDFFAISPLKEAQEILERVADDQKNFSKSWRKKAKEKLEQRSKWGV